MFNGCKATDRDTRHRLKKEKYFYRVEALHYNLYKTLAKGERNHRLKQLLEKLVKEEEGHMNAWRDAVLEHQHEEPGLPATMALQIFFFQMLRRVLGVAFVTGLLEKDEASVLQRYIESKKSMTFSAKERASINKIIGDEKIHEEELTAEMRIYEGETNYIRSIVYGLNDGLVELLGVVVGLAVIATSPLVVVIGGLVVGISGTLSMAGGAYLSSRAETLASASKKTIELGQSPAREALYTGIYYFIGALISVLPFALGFSGISGIIGSILLVIIALVIASVVIAVISYTSIKRRIGEMLLISLSVAFVTIILGYIIRSVFGITI